MDKLKKNVIVICYIDCNDDWRKNYVNIQKGRHVQGIWPLGGQRGYFKFLRIFRRRYGGVMFYDAIWKPVFSLYLTKLRII